MLKAFRSPYMSKNQWIGIVILLVLIASLEFCAYFTRRYMDQHSDPSLLVMQPEREEAFEQYLDSLREAEYVQRRAQYKSSRDTIAIRLQPFDPNSADSCLLVTVGLKPWMAHNLIRYRKAGKIFRKKEDLRRLYGMNDSLYATLEPYITIDSTLSKPHDSLQADTAARAYTIKKDTVIELNSADTTTLQLIKGIGHYTAMQIIHRRSQLGGYCSVEQLYEIPTLPHERVDSILPHLYVDTTLITRLDVNHASVKQLQRHPYISYPQAEKTYDLRRRKIRLKKIDELADIFSAEELKKLRPYLTFGD